MDRLVVVTPRSGDLVLRPLAVIHAKVSGLRQRLNRLPADVLLVDIATKRPARRPRLAPAQVAAAISDRPRRRAVRRLLIRQVVLDVEELQQIKKVRDAGLEPKLLATRTGKLPLPPRLVAVVQEARIAAVATTGPLPVIEEGRPQSVAQGRRSTVSLVPPSPHSFQFFRRFGRLRSQFSGRRFSD